MRSNKLRILSVSGIVVSLLMAAGPASAHDYRNAYAPRYANAPRHTHFYRPAVRVVPAPVITYGYPAAPVYYQPAYAPAPAYYAPPAYAPAPAYYGPGPAAYAPLGALGGAVAGAAIGSGFGRGHDRAAAIAIGGVLGAIVGDSLAHGR